jgi:hypothetical protein
MSDETCVRHFLEAHPYLPPLLDEAHPYIARCFPNASLTLRVEGDPETGPLADQLVVRIGITSGPEAALAHLKRFDSEWWLDKVAQAQGKLVINLEFI